MAVIERETDLQRCISASCFIRVSLLTPLPIHLLQNLLFLLLQRQPPSTPKHRPDLILYLPTYLHLSPCIYLSSPHFWMETAWCQASEIKKYNILSIACTVYTVSVKRLETLAWNVSHDLKKKLLKIYNIGVCLNVWNYFCIINIAVSNIIFFRKLQFY